MRAISVVHRYKCRISSFCVWALRIINFLYYCITYCRDGYYCSGSHGLVGPLVNILLNVFKLQEAQGP